MMSPKLLAAAAVLALAIAACGSTIRTSSPTGSARITPAVAWARCLRAHGLTSFPDPIPGHRAMFPDSGGKILATRSPAVLAAEQACKHENPLASSALGGPGAGQKTAILEYAKCMRAHDVPTYPDPTYGKDGRLTIPDLSGDGIDTQSPGFTNAAKSCNGHGIPVG